MNQWTTVLEPRFYMVIDEEGSKITARIVTNVRTMVEKPVNSGR